MKKKVLFTSIVMLLVCVMTVCVSAAYSGTCGTKLTWVLDDNGTLTISGTGKMANMYSSNPPWYSHRSSIKKVIIEDGVTSIGSSAFYDCTSLAGVTIGNGVTSIDKRAFYYCTSLASIDIPDSVTSIGDFAFSGCTSLESIEIPDSVTRIGNDAFYNCTSLASVTIGNGVTTIGYYAFDYCSSLASVTIGNGVTSIGYGAFRNCSSLAVYYSGTQTQWSKISIGSSNEPLLNATIHYNHPTISATKSKDGNSTKYIVELKNIPVSSKVIAALYQNDRFVGMVPGTYNGETLELPTSIAHDEAKIVVFNNLNSISPLAKAKEFTNNK